MKASKMSSDTFLWNHLCASAGPKFIIQRLCHSPVQYVIIELADKLYNPVTVFFVLHESMSLTGAPPVWPARAQAR